MGGAADGEAAREWLDGPARIETVKPNHWDGMLR